MKKETVKKIKDAINSSGSAGEYVEVAGEAAVITHHNETLSTAERVTETNDYLEEQVIKLMDMVQLVRDQQDASIKELQKWRKKVEMEALHMDTALHVLDKKLTKEKLQSVEDLADVMERINKIEPSALLGKLFN